MGEQASSQKEPRKPKVSLRFLRSLIFSPLLHVLPPTGLSKFRPQNKMIYSILGLLRQTSPFVREVDKQLILQDILPLLINGVKGLSYHW